MSERKKNIFLFIIMNALILSAALLYDLLFDKGLVGDCVFLETFRIYCPGCGGSRSLSFLLDFNLIKSFIYYPPIPITALIILDAEIRLVLGIIYSKSFIRRMRRSVFLIIPVSIILNFILRNFLLLAFGIDLLGNLI